jgi:hypothetical protein
MRCKNVCTEFAWAKLHINYDSRKLAWGEEKLGRSLMRWRETITGQWRNAVNGDDTQRKCSEYSIKILRCQLLTAASMKTIAFWNILITLMMEVVGICMPETSVYLRRPSYSIKYICVDRFTNLTVVVLSELCTVLGHLNSGSRVGVVLYPCVYVHVFLCCYPV